MLYFNLGIGTICDDTGKSYLTFTTKSSAKKWLLEHNYDEYEGFPGVFFEGSYFNVEYKIRKFLNQPFYGIVRECKNKREFLPYMD